MSNDIAKKVKSQEMFTLLNMEDLEPNEGQLDGLPANPREIDEQKFDLLKSNIKQYPQFLQYNMLKVYCIDNINNKYIIIGGNMRYRAMKELGFTQAPCAIFPQGTNIEDLKAYTILDNNSFGKYDWAMLANEWDEQQLQSWGTELPVMGNTDMDFDKFFNEDENKGKDSDYKITVTLDKDKFNEEQMETVKKLIEDSVSDYDGVKIK